MTSSYLAHNLFQPFFCSVVILIVELIFQFHKVIHTLLTHKWQVGLPAEHSHFVAAQAPLAFQTTKQPDAVLFLMQETDIISGIRDSFQGMDIRF